MKKVIYYFTATGNSLATARLLAESLGDCEVRGAAAVRNDEEVIVDADMVGFVYPVYYSDMPCTMRMAISRMKFTGNPYIFSVCTCRGHCGNVAQRLNELLERAGQKLSFADKFLMPGNSRISTPDENTERLASQRERLEEIILKLKEMPVEDHSSVDPIAPSPVDGPANMRGVTVDDSCIGCGSCVKVCPMDNIKLTDGKAVIGDNCATCLACFHWCPTESIWCSKAEEPLQRRFKYRHPEVTAQDIEGQKKA